MLVIDLNALKPVYSLNLLEHIVLNGTKSLDLKDIVGIYTTFSQLISRLKHCTVRNLDP